MVLDEDPSVWLVNGNPVGQRGIAHRLPMILSNTRGVIPLDSALPPQSDMCGALAK
jgi:hypothetical protein